MNKKVKLEQIETLKGTIEALIDWVSLLYYSNFSEYLWDDLTERVQIFDIVCGTAKHLFDENLSPELLELVFTSLTEIDILIDENKFEKLESILPNSITKTQKNSFTITYFDTEFNFIGAAFDYDKPTIFTNFAYSSNLTDLKYGFSGKYHKLLLKSLVEISSQDDSICIIEEVDKGWKTIEVGKIKKTPSLLKYTDKGLREKYSLIEDMKFFDCDCYKKNEKDASKYITSPKDIFLAIFVNSEYDSEKFGSFVGLMDYMQKEFVNIVLEQIITCFVKKLKKRNYDVDIFFDYYNKILKE